MKAAGYEVGERGGVRKWGDKLIALRINEWQPTGVIEFDAVVRLINRRGEGLGDGGEIAVQ